MSKISRSYAMGVETYRDEQGMLQSPDNDTAARVSSTRTGQTLKEFYSRNELHRDKDLPAFDGTIESGSRPLLIQGWFQHGQAHREGDKPAAIEHDLFDDVVTFTFSKKGVLSRDPAIGPASFKIKLDRVNEPVILTALFFHEGKQVVIDRPNLKVVRRDDFGVNSVPFDVQIVAQEIVLPPVAVASEVKAFDEKIETLLTGKQPEVVKEAITKIKADLAKAAVQEEAPVVEKKKGGRPKGAKNKKT
jgi:hypothetical protein